MPLRTRWICHLSLSVFSTEVFQEETPMLLMSYILSIKQQKFYFFRHSWLISLQCILTFGEECLGLFNVCCYCQTLEINSISAYLHLPGSGGGFLALRHSGWRPVFSYTIVSQRYSTRCFGLPSKNRERWTMTKVVRSLNGSFISLVQLGPWRRWNKKKLAPLLFLYFCFRHYLALFE